VTANLRISHTNLVKTATLASSPVSAVTGPVDNLKTTRRGVVYRAGQVGSSDITGHWGGSNKAMSCCILYRTNLRAGDTWRLQICSDLEATVPVWDSGTVTAVAAGVFGPGVAPFAVMYFTPVTGVSFRLTVNSPANVAEAMTLWIGTYMEAAYNPAYGLRRGRQSGSQRGRTLAGSLVQTTGAVWRTLSFDLFVRTEADRAAWDEIDEASQTDPVVWLAVFPAVGGTQERDFSMLGCFDDPLDLVLSAPNKFDFTVKFIEV
jgi:hypothetical protein